MMMQRAFFACLAILLMLTCATASAGSRVLTAELDNNFFNLFKRRAAEHQEQAKPRRLRELRMKEAVRRGDLTPEEAKIWRLNKQRLQEGAARPDEAAPPQPPLRGLPAGRSNWRETQRRQLEGGQ
jgi:hypothetical protein